MMEDLLQAGVITTTHGIRGEVKVFPTTDDVHRFEDLDSVLLDTGREYMELEIENVKYFKQYAILKFKGIDNINDIEKYKGRSLYVTRDQAIPLEEDEYYIADLIGLDIYLENGEKFGVLKDVMETGANDVYIVETEEGKEVLIPAIHECVLDIDVEENRMEIHLMDGLLD
ncbi:ribosome maturation factor RimM [Blautia hominis]|uniref:Ribosome maturation factor RimM n=2 Tax=Lachnospiraceae TaxID=186803 RepID=A0ABQ0BB12_9FIRM|nr:ribosome maturation factor RimM [Blautia hominis]